MDVDELVKRNPSPFSSFFAYFGAVHLIGFTALLGIASIVLWIWTVGQWSMFVAKACCNYEISPEEWEREMKEGRA